MLVDLNIEACTCVRRALLDASKKALGDLVHKVSLTHVYIDQAALQPCFYKPAIDAVVIDNELLPWVY